MLLDTLHFSFTVSSIERSIAWYRDVLGLDLVHRQRQENAYTPLLVGIPGAVLEIAQFRVPGVSPGRSTHMLELVEYVAPRGRSSAGRRRTRSARRTSRSSSTTCGSAMSG